MILQDIAEHPGSRATDVRKRLQRPHNTVDRELQALHILGLLVQEEASGTGWIYSLTSAVEPETLKLIAFSRNGCMHTQGTQEERSEPCLQVQPFLENAS